MTIRPRTSGWQVEVNCASALPKYRRVRVQHNGSRESAELLEKEIAAALRSYRKWPVEDGDEVYVNSTTTRSKGTLRECMELALKTRWAGTRWGETVEVCLRSIVRFFEERRGVYDLDDMTSADVDAFVADCRSRGNTAVTINKNLSMLSVLYEVGSKRTPKLCTTRVDLPRLRPEPIEKWWLRPEDFEKAVAWLRVEKGDPLFADLIEMMVYQGLRVEETLRLSVRDFTGLDTDKPWLKVPGTKTKKAGSSIPVFGWSLELCERCLQRCKVLRQDRLFPYTRRQASDRWNEVRAYLGVSDVKTATLKALRRTFAYYATTKGKMPTKTLQDVLRHETITTTQGYLELTGGEQMEHARDYLKGDTKPSNGDMLKAAIEAFKAAGASPEEVARFTKEMLK